jgi:hypothetical protein
MLAEIFIMRLEMQIRVAAANMAVTRSDQRFVPVTLARETAPKTASKPA